MICGTCGAQYNTLICAGCAERKSKAAYREYQLHPLREVAAEGTEIVTRTDGGTTHLHMYGCNKTFCWVTVEGSWRKGRMSLPKLVEKSVTGGLCAGCYEEFTKLISEALPCSQ